MTTKDCLSEVVKELQVGNIDVIEGIFKDLITEPGKEALLYLCKAIFFAMTDQLLEGEKKCVEFLHKSEEKITSFDKESYSVEINKIISVTWGMD